MQSRSLIAAVGLGCKAEQRAAGRAEVEAPKARLPGAADEVVQRALHGRTAGPKKKCERERVDAVKQKKKVRSSRLFNSHRLPFFVFIF